MAKFMKHVVIGKILELGLVPVFYHDDLETAKKIVQACVDGGQKIIEFTNRGDFAYQVFAELAKWVNTTFKDVIIGVGSVIDPETAALYINSGANFVVGPVFNPEIAKVCNRRKVPYSPGCGSATEISQAEEMGCDIVKVFPGEEVGGPSFIKNMLAPCPWVKLMPTGGVDTTRESISEWIKAGAAALGIGSKLISKELVATGDFEAITKKVEQCLWWIQEARGTPLFLGIEHVGLYPNGATAEEITNWYADTFGLTKTEGTSSFFISGKGSGRIEIMKAAEPVKCHIAVRVSNFEEACKRLQEKGFELEEPKIKKGTKAAFLKTPDPAGNRVHILYQAP
ncbi:bifunctional 4-hydroxy-2-oxoglutarate aldolase/2-dehydro-3-deoxy-phosphogluconate aldolase [Candidatus Bathyarchaeota archaeon]|nr:bifunctional 4-hydroxy-2-oxoglutarate aldolase/2-dehydro-3-deoxy-phosphogluconate aldolase [Candidatus Bathyarchaeota archaeon]